MIPKNPYKNKDTQTQEGTKEKNNNYNILITKAPAQTNITFCVFPQYILIIVVITFSTVS